LGVICQHDSARAYLIFGDIEGKLDALRVECSKCCDLICPDLPKVL